jgi:hypothetical protein
MFSIMGHEIHACFCLEEECYLTRYETQSSSSDDRF